MDKDAKQKKPTTAWDVNQTTERLPAWEVWEDGVEPEDEAPSPEKRKRERERAA